MGKPRKVRRQHGLPHGMPAANGMWASHDTHNNIFRESDNMNVYGWNIYFWKLKELATTRIRWEGMPEGIDRRYFEEILFFNGGALWSRDEIMGDMVSAFTAGGTRNIYNLPTQREVYTPNGYHSGKSIGDSVIIWNNYNRLPDAWICEYYANRIYTMDRSADINILAQRTPVVIKATEEQKLTMKNIWMKYEGNEPVIFTEDTLDLANGNGVQVLKTDAPFVADKINEMKLTVWWEALTFLGINSPQRAKQQQLVSAEVRQNASAVASYRAAFLKPRIEAAEEINRMFGLHIEPVWNAEEIEQKLASPASELLEQAAEASMSETGE